MEDKIRYIKLILIYLVISRHSHLHYCISIHFILVRVAVVSDPIPRTLCVLDLTLSMGHQAPYTHTFTSIGNLESSSVHSFVQVLNLLGAGRKPEEHRGNLSEQVSCDSNPNSGLDWVHWFCDTTQCITTQN